MWIQISLIWVCQRCLYDKTDDIGAFNLDKFAAEDIFKGALSWYGKLTWESAHAWNLIILCLLIVWGMTFIFMVHLSFYAIPLLIYDVMYDITTIP